jgi:hypothetical protein
MPTLEELIASLNVPAPDVEIAEPEVWPALDTSWQPPTSLPPGRKLTVAWLWGVLWNQVFHRSDSG